MTNEELEKIRRKYNSLIETKKDYQKLKKEMETLEEDSNVRRYLEVIQMLESYKSYSVSNVQNDSEFVESAIRSVRPSNTNNIYIYMGTFEESDEYAVIHNARDIKVARNSERADYSLYRNLELLSFEDFYEVKVPIQNRENFEEENIVIVPPRMAIPDEYYNQVRTMYFKKCIKDGQEKALEKILYKRNQLRKK